MWRNLLILPGDSTMNRIMPKMLTTNPSQYLLTIVITTLYAFHFCIFAYNVNLSTWAKALLTCASCAACAGHVVIIGYVLGFTGSPPNRTTQFLIDNVYFILISSNSNKYILIFWKYNNNIKKTIRRNISKN